jgi:PHD/YefM family antitoxin component YafN of YafNO toxin-antitoxin module
VIITRNGKPAAVLSTPEEFDRLRERAHFVQSVEEGLADSKAGRVVPHGRLRRELEEDFGPLDIDE